jgi:hypothetical protein
VALCVETHNGCGLRSAEPRDWSQFGTSGNEPRDLSQLGTSGNEPRDLSQLGTSGNAPVRTTSAAMSCSLRLLCWLVRFST